MRVVLDTNIIVSALLTPAGMPAAIVRIWLDGKFTLLTCATQLDELRSTLEKPRVAELVKPYKTDAWSTKSRSSPKISIHCRA